MYKIIRALDDLTVTWQDGEPWFDVGQVAQVCRQPSVGQITKHIPLEHKRRFRRKTGFYKEIAISQVNSAGLLTACRYYLNAPLADVRIYLDKLSGRM